MASNLEMIIVDEESGKPYNIQIWQFVRFHENTQKDISNIILN